MRKVTVLAFALLMVALAIGTLVPAAEAVVVCTWTCNCAGTPVCVCPPGTTGFCAYPPIGCPQVYNC